MKMTVLGGVLVLAVSASATGDLTWTGAVNSTWDTTTQNWKNDSGSSCAFATGDNVTIGSGSVITLGSTLMPGNVLFNISSDMSLGFSGSSMFETGMKSFVKTGPGKLTVTATGGSQAFRRYNGEVKVSGGTMALVGANQYASFGGVSTGTFVVENGATLQVVNRNCFGKVDVLNGAAASIVVRKGSKLQLGPDGTSHTGNTVKNLTLDGGSLVFAGTGLGTKVGTLNVLDTLSVSGDTSQVITDMTAGDNNRLGIAWQKDANGAATGAARTVFDVANVTGDDRADFIFEKPLTRGNNFNNTAGFVKKGDGTMKLAYDGVSSSSSGYYGRQIGANGDIDILGGTLDFAGAWTFPVPNAIVQTITVGKDATLLISNPNAISRECFSSTEIRPLTRILVKEGAFKINCPGFESGHVFMGDQLMLEDATFGTTLNGIGDSNGSLGALSLGSLLAIKGTKPCVLNPSEAMTNTRMALLNDPVKNIVATEIRVDDVTGDAAVDAMIGFKLCDYRIDRPGYTSTRAGGLVKTGSGTLLLAPTTAGLNTFSGDVEVREGVVRLDVQDGVSYSSSLFGTADKSYLGDLKNTTYNPTRKITVNEGAAIEFCQRNMLDSYGYGETGGNDITAEFVLKGGTLRIVGNNSGNTFGNITIEGGAIEYGDTSSWGAINFRGIFKVKGTKPVVLPESATPRLALYPSYACIFDVDDVTGDGAADLISGLVPCKPADATYFNGTKGFTFTYGFVKRGSGTMALNRAMRNTADFDAEARVEAGAVLFNDDFSKAGGTVVVSSGAAVGGSGKVAKLVLNAGADLISDLGVVEPLEVTGELTVPTTGAVRVRLPSDSVDWKLRAGILKVGASCTAVGVENFANWKLEVEGGDVSRYTLSFSNGQLRVTPNIGMIVVLR